MLGKPRIAFLYPNLFNNFNKTIALLYDPLFLYHFYEESDILKVIFIVSCYTVY